MFSNQDNIDYKHKALKYKAKYLELKKQFERMNIGGNNVPVWYSQFEEELREIYDAVYRSYHDVIFTGSGVIAYLLKELEMYDELEGFKPNDLDFLYRSKLGESNPNMIMDYKIKQGQEHATSVTFILNKDSTKFIKSFDVSRTEPRTKSFNFKGINFINLNTLKSEYKPDFGTPKERVEKDKYKIDLIDKIIQKIGSEGRLNEFGLADNITVRDTKRKTRSLFGDDDNNDNDDVGITDTDDFMNRNFGSRFNNLNDFDSSSFESPKKKSYTKSTGLFGYESDDEKISTS